MQNLRKCSIISDVSGELICNFALSDMFYRTDLVTTVFLVLLYSIMLRCVLHDSLIAPSWKLSLLVYTFSLHLFPFLFIELALTENRV
jgi:hypothetical protein